MARQDDLDQLLTLFAEIAEERLWIGTLLVFPHNAPAIALYKRFGFEERRRYERFKTRQNGEVWDVSLMELPL